MTFLRSFADDLPLQDWLNTQVFPMEAKLNEEHIYHLSKLAILEYLTSGITSNFDMYLTPDSIVQSSIDCGFRTVLTGGVNDFSQSVELVDEWYQKYNGYHELISFTLGFHAEYTNSRENLEGMAALAKKYRAPVYTHNSETASEVQQCIDRTGMTPTAYLDSLGMFDYGGGGYHCVHMTDEESRTLPGEKPLGHHQSGVQPQARKRHRADLRHPRPRHQPCHRHRRTGEQQLPRYVPRDVPCDRTGQGA